MSSFDNEANEDSSGRVTNRLSENSAQREAENEAIRFITKVSSESWFLFRPMIFKAIIQSIIQFYILLIFEYSQRPILLSKFKRLTNTAGTNNKFRVIDFASFSIWLDT